MEENSSVELIVVINNTLIVVGIEEAIVNISDFFIGVLLLAALGILARKIKFRLDRSAGFYYRKYVITSLLGTL